MGNKSLTLRALNQRPALRVRRLYNPARLLLALPKDGLFGMRLLFGSGCVAGSRNSAVPAWDSVVY